MIPYKNLIKCLFELLQNSCFLNVKDKNKTFFRIKNEKLNLTNQFPGNRNFQIPATNFWGSGKE